jgi:hypothetical protein
MPYGIAAAYRNGNRLIIEVELPEHGEQSQRGFADNLVDPREWLDVANDDAGIRIKLNVCRPRRAWQRRSAAAV